MQVEDEGGPLDGALLAAVVESTHDAVVSVDLAGRITSWNPAATVLYGHSATEALGASLAMLYPSPDDPAAMLRRIAAGERIDHAEAVRVRRDGTTVRVGETISPVRGVEGEVVGVAAIARDISARIEAEEALARAQLELEEKNRRLERSNAELEQFAYVASHDLSEPLRAVAGMVGLLGRRYGGQLDDDADEFIAFAVDGCARMRNMIEDLLAFSRAGRTDLRVEDVDLGEVVAEVLRSLRAQVEETGAQVDVGELPVLPGDRAQLTQLLQNLVSNAIKFRRPDVTPTIDVAAVEEVGAWRIEVADNGIGIEEQYRSRIFRMFQRLHAADAYPGTGIGLAIAERIADRHGGRMGVESNERGGSTFWFTIAVSATEEGAG